MQIPARERIARVRGAIGAHTALAVFAQSNGGFIGVVITIHNWL